MKTTLAHKIFDLTGKVAIVTGSTRGIGKVIAEGLAHRGVKLTICGTQLPEAEKTAKIIQDAGGEAIAIQADVTKRQDCANLINQTVAYYNQLDIMVCNAGINTIKPALSLLEAEWDAIIDVDLKGYFNCAQLAAQHMIQQGTGGSIIMNSSIASVVGIPGVAAYTAAKGGVNQLVRTLGIEWAAHGIRVNAIAPGYMENIMEGSKANYPDLATQEQLIKTFIPMNRRGKLEELVGPVVFLASEAASYVTGSILMVDGACSAM
ncbi:SDR family NAD(P)-dependent oxidoreductase [Planktothrix pseudagardhii]|uniref:2-dehydro-3-deoxy-D-gluconate 5-dehydrogenase n=1 Tax=Planktothrix pseudagardhii TaxID=132604 RepID=A0A9W4CJA0_9CYAN|nr:SDR family NAD(P)-dependent oxidoreductase [Planktothrix pseudagardhii]CAD5944345.1 2-dehydro-3-deoxy-D-gluconate 5-dehydrogenase [Planktothrix pseudagardhii]